MLLNWQETLDDFFTLVHEMGHSMHSTFTRENQPYVYGDYPIFLAEIASTTNENILTESLLAESTDEKVRFAILNHWLDGFRGTVFRQSQFAEFEHEIHKADQEGKVLTSEFMNQLYAGLNEKYYGLAAQENPEIQYEWARIPHFYYNFMSSNTQQDLPQQLILLRLSLMVAQMRVKNTSLISKQDQVIIRWL